MYLHNNNTYFVKKCFRHQEFRAKLGLVKASVLPVPETHLLPRASWMLELQEMQGGAGGETLLCTSTLLYWILLDDRCVTNLQQLRFRIYIWPIGNKIKY